MQYKETLEKTEWAIKNVQYRDTGNIGHTRHKMKTNKTKTQYNTTQNTKTQHKTQKCNTTQNTKIQHNTKN